MPVGQQPEPAAAEQKGPAQAAGRNAPTLQQSIPQELLRSSAARKLALADSRQSLVVQQQQYPHLPSRTGGAGSSSSVSLQHAAVDVGHLTRDPAPLFSGWSANVSMAHPPLQPHPPGGLNRSMGISSSSIHLQQGGVSPNTALRDADAAEAAAAAAAHCSWFAAGALKVRARRKSTSDAAPHHVPFPLVSRRRKSDGGIHSSSFHPQSPAFLFQAGTAAGGSSHSSSAGSSPGVIVSIGADNTGYLPVDARSTGSVSSSQHHHLVSITEGVPLTNAEVSAPDSPVSPWQAGGHGEQHQEQQLLQQQQLQQELQHYQQMAQQKQLELQQLLQQQHNRVAQNASTQPRRSPTPPSHGSGIPSMCISPRASAVFRQLGASNSSAAGGSGSGGSSRRAATEPPPTYSGSTAAGSASSQSQVSSYSGRSPGAAAMVMTSSSTGRTKQQQQQAAAAAPAGTATSAQGRAQPVARDITQRLQMQRPAMQLRPDGDAGVAPELQHSSIWDSWGGHGLAGSAAQPGAQSSGQQQPQAGGGVSQPDTMPTADQQQQQQHDELPPARPAAAASRSRPTPQRSRSSSNIAKSPAPPPVPPSPQQHAVAELRTRRSSCSNIPHLSNSGLVAPSPRSVLSYSDWAQGTGPGSMGYGQQGEHRASSSTDAKLTVKVCSPEAETDSLWSTIYARQQGSPRYAEQAATGSPEQGGAVSSRLEPVPEQYDVQAGTDFLSMQEQRLARRDQGQSAAATAAAAAAGAAPGRSLLAAEGSSKDVPSSGLKALSAQVLGALKAAGSAGGAPAAALPPPHPPVQHDVPSTPRGHMMLNPQHTVPRSAHAALGSGSGLQLLQQPQQPVPPRAHAPSCRSPCVSTRQHVPQISPAAAAWLGNHGALAGQQTHCSPILEQAPYGTTSSNASTGGSSTRPAGEEGLSAWVGGPPTEGSHSGSHPSSSGSTTGLGPSAAGSSSISATPGSGSGSARMHLSGGLPRPAFDQLARSISLDESFLKHQQHQQMPQQQQQPGMRSPSPPTAPDATAIIHGYSRPVRALSPVVRKAPGAVSAALSAGFSTSNSNQQQRDQEQRLQRLHVPKSPSPPPMGAAAMIAASPRVGAHVVQPCPPVNSLPPVSPSPSVRTRVLTQHSSQATAQQGGQSAVTGGLGGQAAGTSGVPQWAGGSPLVGVPGAAAKALTFSSSAEGPAAAQASGVATLGPAAAARPGRLLQPVPPPPSSSGSGTPDMSWMQTADMVHPAPPASLLQGAAKLHADSAASVSTATGGGTAVAAGMTAGASGAAAAAAGQEALGWQAAAVVAFSHYRGRLGYLMNTGVVGVLFEDASTMTMRGDMRSVCYIQPHSTASAAAAAGVTAAACYESPASKGKQHAAGAAAACGSAAAMRRGISTDLGQSDQTAGQHMQAFADGHACSSDGKMGSEVQLFHLPDALAATHSSSDLGSPAITASSVPEHLVRKLRCIRRFVGCLLRHQPYSSKRHLDVTRLLLPAPLALQHEAQHKQQRQLGELAGLDGSCVHVQHFNYSEGCVLLTLTDGCQQLVFTSDGSTMLLNPTVQQLAYAAAPGKRRHKHGGFAAGSRMLDTAADTAALLSCSDSDEEVGGSGSEVHEHGAAELVVLKLGAGGALAELQDAHLLARLKQAIRLPEVAPLLLEVGPV